MVEVTVTVVLGVYVRVEVDVTELLRSMSAVHAQQADYHSHCRWEVSRSLELGTIRFPLCCGNSCPSEDQQCSSC